MLRALLLMFAVMCCAAAPARSPAVRAEFRKVNPCPATGQTAGACPGWQIDHRQALICGGVDEVANLQWLQIAEHREKSRAEVKLCRTNKHTKEGRGP